MFIKNTKFNLCQIKREKISAPLSCKGAGFTLLEIIIVIGIMAILFSIGLPIGLGFYRSYQFDSETTLLVSLLENARTLAMINFNESPQGLYIDANNFTVFQGASYASRSVSQDKTFLRNAGVTITGPSEIVFSQLSGKTSSSTYIVSNGPRNININVNAEGTILY